MPSFRYTAMTRAGKRTDGLLAGSSEQAVLAELEARHLVPVRLEEQAERRIGIGGVSSAALATAYTQLSDLLRAGVPLLRGIRLLARRKSSPKLARVFRDVGDAVADGNDLADAMASHPDAFPKMQIAMVRAGERGGFLEQVLQRIGILLQSQAELRGRLIGNLIYPAILVISGVAVLSVVFGVFVPKFRPIFASLEEAGQLPAISRFVFGVSAVIEQHGLLALLLLGGLIGAAWWWTRQPAGQAVFARVQIRAPIVGPVVRAWCIARFCRVLGTMLANAIPMIDAMEISRDAAGNAVLEAAIDRAIESVRHGDSLAPPLAESGLFAEDIIEMLSVGESANNLDSVLLTIADTIEGRIDRLLNTAVKLIEPLILLALAGAVLVVAMALVLPISRISSLAG